MIIGDVIIHIKIEEIYKFLEFLVHFVLSFDNVKD